MNYLVAFLVILTVVAYASGGRRSELPIRRTSKHEREMAMKRILLRRQRREEAERAREARENPIPVLHDDF